MVPTPIRSSNARNLRILYPIANIAANFGPKVVTRVFNHDETHQSSALHKRAAEVQGGELIAFAILIPVLVLLSGLFAGLTLGYMSLDETQLHVLSISGTPKQKEYARKIQPIRKNGHLLLITLILANMIVNETLPVIADPVLGGGVPGVVVSTVLIVIFSEILPQSICTRYGLAIGAHMAWFVRILILVLGVVAWPVAKFLEFILGSHHGIMYRRAELKELIALHSSNQELGGDLKSDTVTIIGATLDLQEKVVRQAMTAIEKVFMLSIDDKLDYDTMKRIYDTGHSRVPVYEEIEVPVITESLQEGAQKDFPVRHKKVKKIVGVLLVKQCLLLDPKEATPIRSLKLNPLPCVPMNEPLLSILDRFQTGRSHMAIVSRFSEEKAESVKKQVKKNFTRKLKDRVGIHSSSEESSDSASDGETEGSARTPEDDHPSDAPFDEKLRRKWRKRRKSRKRQKEKADLERGEGSTEQGVQQQVPSKDNVPKTSKLKDKLTSVGREQQMPDDAVLPKGGAKEFLQSVDPAVMPLGIITLEDVLEELIGEEIYDEFDPEGRSHLKYYNPVNGRKAVRPKTFGGSNVDGLPAPAKADSEPHHGNAASTPQSPVSISATPASPTISEDQPHSRAESLANSLGALVFRRRDRSGQRQGPGKHSASDTDLVMLKRRKVAEEPAIAVSPTKELQEEDDRDDATHSGERNNEAR